LWTLIIACWFEKRFLKVLKMIDNQIRMRFRKKYIPLGRNNKDLGEESFVK